MAALVPRLLAEEPADTAAIAAGGVPAAAVAPPPKAPAFGGTYRVDANRAGEKYNGVPNPEPPNVSTWWAVKSSCDASACTASATMLDAKDHRKTVKTPSGGNELAMEFTGDTWRSQPQTVHTPCIGVDGRQDSQTTTQVLTLEPTIPGVLHGAMVATVESNECGQRGAQIWVPVVASRFGDVPAGINPSVEMAKPAKPA